MYNKHLPFLLDGLACETSHVRLTAETRDQRVIDVYIVLMIIVLSYNDTR